MVCLVINSCIGSLWSKLVAKLKLKPVLDIKLPLLAIYYNHDYTMEVRVQVNAALLLTTSVKMAIHWEGLRTKLFQLNWKGNFTNLKCNLWQLVILGHLEKLCVLKTFIRCGFFTFVLGMLSFLSSQWSLALDCRS